ncbi:phosphate uptake regulator, PhoU [Alkalihalophilus pseudofirmus OF4]|uniref:Phosphate uptake regulator, PhoU n=1 Tax=Alkalihalophilus pseudofirmus (strain ATCC BAA-2126 / JCM 17055 / OF4) TaxID=398511 RepID=D3FXU4_ALKPO|nr:phosphate uptake regulator PhoU [Alkalihalophilus pseudofirmus]ADC48931.1 phosphate uptake regulator, PhoU [Alkalihalophilus pseudofirmus OF4]
MLTRTNFLDREINELKERLLLMVELSYQMLQLSSESIEKDSTFDKESILQAEKDMNAINKVIQKKVLELLSYEQLAIKQVKGLFLFSKMAKDLERVGDHVINIIVVAPIDSVPHLVIQSFSQFMKNIGQMLESLKEGIKEEDCSRLKAIYEKEDEVVNRLNKKSFKRITDSLSLEQLPADSGGKLILMSRFFERMADHVSNAARDYRQYLLDCHSSISRNSP